jgi:excisionase family DNA binding protein
LGWILTSSAAGAAPAPIFVSAEAAALAVGLFRRQRRQSLSPFKRDQGMNDEPSGPAAPSRALRLLSLTQVGEVTGLSTSTLRRQIRLKRLAVHWIGNTLRIAEDDLLAWLAQCRRAAR